MTTSVLSELKDGVRTITLNRPAALNAMNGALVGLAIALEEANEDPATRAIVLTGNGRAFCAGADLKERDREITEALAAENVHRIQRVTRAMVLGPKFIVGAINGWAVGGGFEWAIGCDLSIWSQDAKAFFPEVEWGLFVTGGATAILPAIVGPVKTKEMMLLGQHYSAETLLDLGIAWRVVAPESLQAEAQSVATQVAALPVRSVTDMKNILNRATYADVETAMALETDAAIRGSADPATAARVQRFTKR